MQSQLCSATLKTLSARTSANLATLRTFPLPKADLLRISMKSSRASTTPISKVISESKILSSNRFYQGFTSPSHSQNSSTVLRFLTKSRSAFLCRTHFQFLTRQGRLWLQMEICTSLEDSKLNLISFWKTPLSLMSIEPYLSHFRCWNSLAATTLSTSTMEFFTLSVEWHT